MAKILLIKDDKIGVDELGNKLMNGALGIAYDHIKESGETLLECVILINRGVLLATKENSTALEALKNLSSLGVVVLMCATCVEHFHLKDLEVGEVVGANVIMPLILRKEVASL